PYGRRMHIPDPPLSAGLALVVKAPAQLLDLELELHKAPHDELELATRRALLPAQHGANVHREQPRRARGSDLARKILRLDLVSGREHHHALDKIPQLAHVARPRV